LVEQSPPGARLIGSGLSKIEVDERRARCGRNELPARRSVPAWRQLAGQLTHFFAVLLWVAGLLAFLAGLAQLAVAIFGVVLLNGVFAFLQERRAERAAERLRDLVPQRVLVIRDANRVEVDVWELVPGDLVVLAAGDRIGADLDIVVGHGLRVDESILTGESDPIDLDVGGRGQVLVGLVLAVLVGRQPPKLRRQCLPARSVQRRVQVDRGLGAGLIPQDVVTEDRLDLLDQSARRATAATP